MKKYLRHKNSREVIDACAALALPIDMTAFAEGGDHLLITTPAGPFGTVVVLYNVVSGRFFYSPSNGPGFSSDDTEYDDAPWFNDLLDLFYSDRVA